MDSCAKLIETILFIGSGLKVTLQLLAGGLLIGFSGGGLLAILRHNNIGKWFITQYISIIRGTPVLLQLSLVYFVSPGIGLKLDVITAGIISFGLNSAAYMAEIFRAGIESLPQKQFEAAKTLTIPLYYTWKDIIFPQVLINILPAVINEIIALLKETPIIGIIGGWDILRRSQIVAAERFTYFMPLCIAGLCYYALVRLIEFLARKIEKKISHDGI